MRGHHLARTAEQVVGSENCAACAACRSEAILNGRLFQGTPRVDNAENIIALGVVGRSDDMAFLAAATVHDLDSEDRDLLVFLMANNLHRVETVDGESTAGGGVAELDGGGTGGVADESVDLAAGVGVGLLVERHADQLVGSDVLVEPGEDLTSEGVPVAVIAAVHNAAGVLVAILTGVPGGLAAGTTDVLGGARNAHDIGDAALDSERIGPLKLVVP